MWAFKITPLPLERLWPWQRLSRSLTWNQRPPGSCPLCRCSSDCDSSALNVQLAGAPIPFFNATETTSIGSTSVSTMSSATTGLIDASAIASRTAASAASRASADVSSTTISFSTDSALHRQLNDVKMRGWLHLTSVLSCICLKLKNHLSL